MLLVGFPCSHTHSITPSYPTEPQMDWPSVSQELNGGFPGAIATISHPPTLQNPKWTDPMYEPETEQKFAWNSTHGITPSYGTEQKFAWNSTHSITHSYPTEPQMDWPSVWARNWTEEVFPVPVSPTSRTGSFLFTHAATFSSRHTVGRVYEKVTLGVLLLKHTHIKLQ